MLLSIDPGKSGACAIWTPEGELYSTYKIYTPPKQRFLSTETLEDIQHMAGHAAVVVMEAFMDHRQPNQSPKATNTTAANHGMIHAACALGGRSRPILVLVPPKKWKRQMGLLGTDKKAGVELALTLVDRKFLMKPRMRVPNEDIAEAVLIGIAYGREYLGWTI